VSTCLCSIQGIDTEQAQAREPYPDDRPDRELAVEGRRQDSEEHELDECGAERTARPTPTGGARITGSARPRLLSLTTAWGLA
jgi:hypothetical protein